ncbi:hypothetical protein [Franzmannia pantelleriensis]|uniref:hypothetical protein n=1 Tax=Franzmannia pantelleriensis TaxID=48727 RepID=UPI00159FC30E|nr:hypothetical protein [Halomonas pantelleriensis]
MSVVKRYKMIKFYFDLLARDVLVPELVLKDVDSLLVLYHDGIVHNNPGLNLKATEHDDEEYVSIEKKKPEAIVYFKSSLSANLARRKKRVQDGKATFLEMGLSEGQLKEICRESLDIAEGQLFLMRKMSVPVLVIDAEDDLDYSYIKCHKFISEIS